jgi:hypothetical protein
LNRFRQGEENMTVHSQVRKRIRIWILFGLIIAGSVVLVAQKTFSVDENGGGEPNPTVQKAELPQPNEPPMIIWHYCAYRDSTESLRIALSSGLITHVSVGGTLHRKDRYYKKNPKILKANIKALEAVRIVKNSGAKLIWWRWLWPGYSIEQSSAEDLFDPDYYIQEIKILRAEGRALGADFVALDTEAYAHTPVGKYLRHKHGLNTKQREQLKLTIDKAVSIVGKVDILRPGGSRYSLHPAQIIARLGRYRLSGITRLADEKKRKPIKYPYEIFAAYLNTVKINQSDPRFCYFLVPEIFENSHLWSDKKGLFLYPKEGNALAIAKELVAYSRKLPFKASQQQKRPDSVPK